MLNRRCKIDVGRFGAVLGRCCLRRRILRYVVLAVLLSFTSSRPAYAWGFDIFTLEAIIDDHRDMANLMVFGRNVAEQASVQLHATSRKSVEDYKEVNDSLDKYYKVFDLVEAIVNGGYTVLNAYSCVDRSSTSLSHIYTMLDDYARQVASEGSVDRSDTIIIESLRTCASRIYDDSDQLIASVSDLVLFASGKFTCTSRGLIEVLTRINESLTNIRFRLEHCEYVLYHYLLLRNGYSKRLTFLARPFHEITNDCYDRWKSAARRYGSYRPRYYTYDDR